MAAGVGLEGRNYNVYLGECGHVFVVCWSLVESGTEDYLLL